MPNFTPGPWFARTWEGDEWPEKRWSVGRNDHLGTCVCVSPRYADAKDLTDAHLISAAPELYEALENIVSDFDHLDRDLPQMKAARAALHKARGE